MILSYTKHGHHIPGTSDENPPTVKARCGGVLLCPQCQQKVPYNHKTNAQSLSQPYLDALSKKGENMPLQTKTFTRKPFNIDAVQVTAENLDEVAAWCQGEVRLDEDNRKFIKVRVIRPLNDKQTMAYVGDWVLYAGTGYKVYGDKPFHSSFIEKTDA